MTAADYAGYLHHLQGQSREVLLLEPLQAVAASPASCLAPDLYGRLCITGSLVRFNVQHFDRRHPLSC